jgi:hypothetical protein
MKKVIAVVVMTTLIIHKDVVSADKPDEIVLRDYDAQRKVVTTHAFPLRIINYPALNQSMGCSVDHKNYMAQCLQASNIPLNSILAVYVNHAYTWMFIDVNNDFGLRVIATFPGKGCQLEGSVKHQEAVAISNYSSRAFFDQAPKKFFFSQANK